VGGLLRRAGPRDSPGSENVARDKATNWGSLSVLEADITSQPSRPTGWIRRRSLCHTLDGSLLNARQSCKARLTPSCTSHCVGAVTLVLYRTLLRRPGRLSEGMAVSDAHHRPQFISRRRVEVEQPRGTAKVSTFVSRGEGCGCNKGQPASDAIPGHDQNWARRMHPPTRSGTVDEKRCISLYLSPLLLMRALLQGSARETVEVAAAHRIVLGAVSASRHCSGLHRRKGAKGALVRRRNRQCMALFLKHPCASTQRCWASGAQTSGRATRSPDDGDPKSTEYLCF